MERMSALKVFTQLRNEEPVILGVGYLSSELYALGHSDLYLYNVNFPYPSPLGLGLAVALPGQKVVVMEGDGSALAGLSTLATVADIAPANLVQIVWDNESWLTCGRHRGGHTGPMRTATGGRMDLAAVARGAGYESVCTVSDEAAFEAALARAFSTDGPHYIVARVEEAMAVPTPIPYSITESSMRFRRALIDRGLVDAWHAGATQYKEVAFDFGGASGSSSARLDDIASVLDTAQQPTPPRPSLANARALYEAVLASGVNVCVYLPDSGSYLLQRFAQDDPEMTSVSVTREDEGIAIALGTFMGGMNPCVMMEGSGLGLCYLALAWLGIQQRMGALLLSSHSSGLGEPFDYHASVRYVVDPLLPAMGIPHYLARDVAEACQMIPEAMMTVRGQMLPVSIQLPRRVLWEE